MIAFVGHNNITITLNVCFFIHTTIHRECVARGFIYLESLPMNMEEAWGMVYSLGAGNRDQKYLDNKKDLINRLYQTALTLTIA